MTRIFLVDEQISDDEATIRGSDAHHLLNVLRMNPGDRFTIVDERGAEREATITDVSADVLTVDLGPPRQPDIEPSVHLDLYHGLPRASRYETSLRMCTELGVNGFVPVLSARSVIRLDEDAAQRKRERWQRIVEEAGKQCGRTSIPQVAAPMAWSEALSSFEESDVPGVMPAAGLAGSEALSLGQQASVLADEGIERLALFIGPESGFDLAEESAARDAGVALVTMGPRILRTETAAVVAAAVCLDRLGDLQ